jgi:uncharacterized membrane protein
MLLLAIALFGLLVRTHRLDHLSFWVDEVFSAQMAADGRPSLWLKDVHPPLYYALLSVWQTPHHSDWWLRFLSVIFGVATIPVVYDLGKRLLSERVGLWGAALLSALYVHVKYSQEARMYALMVLLFACAFWGLVVGAREGRAVGWIAYAASGSLLAYTHGLGSLHVLIVALLFPAVSPSPRLARAWRPWVLANSTIALLFVPYLLVYARVVRRVAADYWIRMESPEPPIFSTLFYSTVSPIPPMSALVARHLEHDLGLLGGRWVWFAPVVLVLVVAVASAPPEKRWAVTCLLLAYALPIVLLSVISVVVKPVLIPRVLLPSVVPMVLVLGSLAASTVVPSRWRAIGLATVLIVLLVGDVYHFRYEAKPEWRRASRYLQERVRPTDVILFNFTGGRLLVNRYDFQGALGPVAKLVTEEVTAPCGRGEAPACLERALRAYPRGHTVWVVEGHRSDEARRLVSVLRSEDKVQMVGVSVERTILVY